VKIVCRDASKYMEEKDVVGSYDIIIADTSDPVGPAAALFEAPFYKAMYNTLRPGGKIATQAESIWLNLDLIQRLVRENLNTFDNVEYATTQIPTYPCGQIGFLLCSKAEDNKENTSCKNPCREPDAELDKKLRYYTPEVHRSAFVLPKFVQEALKEVEKSTRKLPQKSDNHSHSTFVLGALAVITGLCYLFKKH